MARLEKLHSGGKKLQDEKTGRYIIQLTGWDQPSEGGYAATNPFGLNESCCVLASKRTGRWEIYKVDIDSFEAVQLSDREGINNHSMSISPNDKEVYYAAGMQVWAVDLQSGEERLVTDCSDVAERPAGFYVTFNDDGSKLLMQYKPHGANSGIAVVASDGSMFETVFVRNEGVQHPRYIPGDDYGASFSVTPDYQNQPQFPYARRARTWQLDMKTGKAFPLIVMPPGYRATHESWAPDGSAIFFHKKTVPAWTPTSIASIPKGGGEITEHFIETDLKLGHSAVNRKVTKVVSDVQEPNDNPLLLIDLTSGEAETLCWPDASISPPCPGQPSSHPHPSFSPSDRWISYSSDRTGTQQVYLVDAR